MFCVSLHLIEAVQIVCSQNLQIFGLHPCDPDPVSLCSNWVNKGTSSSKKDSPPLKLKLSCSKKVRGKRGAFILNSQKLSLL